MKKRIISAMCLGALAALLMPGGVAGARGVDFEFSGDCHVGIFFVPADGDVVQQFLPDGYTVQADPVTRRAVLIVEAGSCSNVLLEGSPIGSYSFGEILALVDPPGDAALAAYDFGAPNTSPAITSRMNSLGLGALHLLTDEIAVKVEEGPVTGLTADVPWRFSPYSLSIDATGAFAPNPDKNDRCCAWTEGSRGTVGGRFRLSHEGQEGELDAAGVGTLEAEAGSPLAQMMGSDTFSGPGFIRRFHFDATMTLFG